MKLKYRGLSYEDNLAKIAQGDVKATGKYRGVEIDFHENRGLPVPQPVQDLVYRGVAYCTGQAASQSNAGAANPAIRPHSPSTASSSIQERSRRLMIKNHRAIERRELTMLSRLASEVGLRTNISRYRNRIQGEFPYSFIATYDRSCAAMS